eukprot:6190327-Pleurochrysis_carterae.AAC.1
MSAPSNPSLAAVRRIHCTDADVMSREISKPLSVECSSSPALRSMLCASSAAAHSIRARRVAPAAGVPDGRLDVLCAEAAAKLVRACGAMASAPPPPGCPGVISRWASSERSIRTAPTYAATAVSAHSTAPGFFFCRLPARRMNSAKRTRVSRLYEAPPGVVGSTNGTSSVDFVKSSNHASAKEVRRASVASATTRARDNSRNASRLRTASSYGRRLAPGP